MDSFFFNIIDRQFKISQLLNRDNDQIKRVDISNGLVFFEIDLSSNKDFRWHFQNLDRMNCIVSVTQGTCMLQNNQSMQQFRLCAKHTYLFTSSRQDIDLLVTKPIRIFVLFYADFFIRRYLSDDPTDPINYLYAQMQQEIDVRLISELSTDALSLYLIDKLLQSTGHNRMNSLLGEHRAIEFLIHRFSLIELPSSQAFDEQQLKIARKARQIIMQDYIDPPCLKKLAHLCHTNEFKLKKAFKSIYQTTVYAYVQKLRLEKANLLLREKVLTVGEVATQVGYKHCGHFSAIFFKTYGVYPKDLKVSFER